MRCTYCGSGAHTIQNCPKTWGGSVNRQNMRCSYCGATDHNIQACSKTYGGNAARHFNPESVADHFIKDQR